MISNCALLREKMHAFVVLGIKMVSTISSVVIVNEY